MRAKLLSSQELAESDAAALSGAVLLAAIRFGSGTLRKGTQLDATTATSLVAAVRAGELTQAVRLAWPDSDDLHEDEAARRLAGAAAGPGVTQLPPRQSRLDLIAACDGVLHVHSDALLRLNSIDSLELFTLFHGQVVRRGQVIASVKVAPHLIPARVVAAGVTIAGQIGASLIEVKAYRSLEAAAIVTEDISSADLNRFEAGARMKVEALGSRFIGTTAVAAREPSKAQSAIRRALSELILERHVPVILVGGVSAGDPLSPFYAALASLGGRVVRHGIPAHPGSMIWLAQLGDSQLLGLPQCGMFTMATAADLILPRMLTGERLTSESLAELAHGGVLTATMRFRFPAYAQDLEAPEG